MGSSIPPQISEVRDQLFKAYLELGVHGEGDDFDETLREFVATLSARAKAGSGAPLDDFDPTEPGDRIRLAMLYSHFVQRHPRYGLPIATSWERLPSASVEGAPGLIVSEQLRYGNVGSTTAAGSPAKVLSYDEFIRIDDEFFDRVFEVGDIGQYVREWRSFLKLFLFRALYLRRMLERPEDGSDESHRQIAHEIQRLDRMHLSAKAFFRYDRDQIHDTWEYKFAFIQRDKLGNILPPLTAYGEVLDRKLTHEVFKGLRGVALQMLRRFSDPFLHLRDLGPYGLAGLPIRFDFIPEGVDLHESASDTDAIDESAIKQEALRFFAVRTALDIISDVAARHSLSRDDGKISHLSIEWDPALREIRVTNSKPAINPLSEFIAGEDRRRLLKFRKRIGEDARIRFMHAFEPDGTRRIDGIAITVPVFGSGENRFTPTEAESAGLGSAIEELSPSKWNEMSEEQRGVAVESAALFAADNGLEPEDVPPEELAAYTDYAMTAAPDMLAGLPLLVR